MQKVYILIIAVLIIGSVSCKKKKEGCSDPKALTYMANADENNDDLCRYTTTTFYASSNTFTGEEVSKIIVTIGQTHDTIGMLTTFNQPLPTTCNTTGTLKYTFQSGVSTVWFARYYLVSGGSVTNQGEFSPSPDEECLRIDILP